MVDNTAGTTVESGFRHPGGLSAFLLCAQSADAWPGWSLQEEMAVMAAGMEMKGAGKGAKGDTIWGHMTKLGLRAGSGQKWDRNEKANGYRSRKREAIPGSPAT